MGTLCVTYGDFICNIFAAPCVRVDCSNSLFLLPSLRRSTAFGTVLSREQEAFHSMFKVRANIHHYVDMGISVRDVT